MEKTKKQNKRPYFSLILPVYNVEKYLEACLESILTQDFGDYEVILVDDGATDSCPDICDRFAAGHNNIKVIHKENGGLSSARNAGLQLAAGEYIWWIDSDDWIEKAALRTIFEASVKNGPDIVKFRYVRSLGNENMPCGTMEAGMYQGEEKLKKYRDEAFYRAGTFCLSAWGHVYRRDFLLDNRLCFASEREIGSEDYLFNLQALLPAEQILVLDESLYFYRLREGSLTQNKRQGLLGKYIELYERLLEYYRDKGALKEYEERISRFFVWHLARGTCISREYALCLQNEGEQDLYRENVRKILREESVRNALEKVAAEKMSRKNRLQLMAMKMRCEPFFYWLYVRKKRRKQKK